MAIVLALKDGRINNDIREYFVDSVDEIQDLPTNINNSDGYICTGSNAYVVTTGQVFMYSSKENKWIEQ